MCSGLLGANLVAFHTPTYAVNFMESCERLIVGARRSSVDTLEYEGRHVAVRALPIGVAYDWFEAMARLAPPQRALQCSPAAAAAALPQQRVILGVDRLDYTKGILQRFPPLSLSLSHTQKQKRKKQSNSSCRFVKSARLRALPRQVSAASREGGPLPDRRAVAHRRPRLQEPQGRARARNRSHLW